MVDITTQKQLDFLGATYDTVLESAKQLRFDADSSSHVLAIALHGTIIELGAACISMLSSGNIVGIPILMRSMYEALADEANLLTDAEYAKNMEAANLRQMERLLSHANDDDIKLDSPKELQTVRNRLAELRQEGHGDLPIFDRFKKAGLEGEYRMMYVLLCLDTHGNTSALIERHVEPAGERVQLTLFKEPSMLSIRAHIDTVTALLLNSAIMIHNAFKSGCEAIEPMREEHAKLRTKLLEGESP